MFRIKSIRRYTRQLIALTEKQIHLELRIKSYFIGRFLGPVLQLIVLFFIFGVIFNIKEGFSIGYWNAENYVLFLLLAFIVQFSRSILGKYHLIFMREKYWKTLSAIMVAPVNRFTLLTGILLSELILNSVPLAILFIIAYILYPIPLIFIFLGFVIYFSIYLTFGAIGLLIGAFGISNENLVQPTLIILRFILIFSCINYPVQIFPEFFQQLAFLNPFYYLFDLLRLVWLLGIDYELAIRTISPVHLISFLTITIIFPFISISLFNRIYKKYGITGY